MAIFNFVAGEGQCIHFGLSTDEKPNTSANGLVFFELDTGKIFRRETATWTEKLNTSYAEMGSGGSTPDATEIIKGKVRLATAPLIASDPIVVGNNDSRNTNARTPTAHTHPEAEVTNLVADLASKAALSHGHVQADITGLVTDLVGKAASVHTHSLADITDDGALAALNTVGANQIDNDAVTYAKIQNVSAISKLLGRGAAAGAGDAEEITLGTNLSMSGTTLNAAGGGGGISALKKTANQTINAGAGVFADVTDLTFSVVNGIDYAFKFYVVFRSANVNTGWRASVNCPTGTLDYFATGQTIANGAAGVATWLQRHNTVRDDMTLLTATITAAVDLVFTIEGRYQCTANGTFAVRFANELAANTDIVVQKGSWGIYF